MKTQLPFRSHALLAALLFPFVLVLGCSSDHDEAGHEGESAEEHSEEDGHDEHGDPRSAGRLDAVEKARHSGRKTVHQARHLSIRSTLREVRIPPVALDERHPDPEVRVDELSQLATGAAGHSTGSAISASTSRVAAVTSPEMSMMRPEPYLRRARRTARK